MKDKDHKMLVEAWKQVYVEEPNMSPEEAQEAHGKGESLMVTTVDGNEFVVAGDDQESIESDPNNGIVFHGQGPSGEEMSARAEDISMIKSLSDRESIRGGFDPSKSHEAQFQGDPEMAQFGKPAAWESVDHEEEEEDDKKKRQTHAWSDKSKKYYKKNPPVEEELDANNEAFNTGAEGNYIEVSTDEGMKLMTPQEAEAYYKKKKKEKVEEGHWSQGEAHMALKSMMKAIRDLEPAQDVREFYKDARIAGVDKSVLAKILDDAVESEDLHPVEAHYIMTGKQDHPDADPSDVGHRGYDKVGEEGCGGPDNEEDRIKRVIIKRIKLMKPESTKVTEGDKKKDKDKEKENEKKLKAKMDADQWYAQYGGQSPYGD